MFVGLADFCAAAAQVIAEDPLDVVLDFLFRRACSCHVDDGGDGVGASDAVRIDVRRHSGEACHFSCLVDRVVEPADAGNAHSRIDSIDVEGLVILEEPAEVLRAVACLGVFPAPAQHRLGDAALDLLVAFFF